MSTQTTALFFGRPAYVEQDVLVGLRDPRIGNAIKVCSGRIVAVNETSGAAVVGVVEPFLSALWGAVEGNQLAGFAATTNATAIAGDPSVLGHFEWMPGDNDAPRRATSGTAIGSTSAPTYGSSTYAVIPEMTVTLLSHGGDLLAMFSGSFSLLDGDAGDVAMYLDGSVVPGTTRHLAYNSSAGALDPAGSIPGEEIVLDFPVPAAAGTHTIDIRWSRTGGTLRAVTTDRSLAVREMRELP